MKNSNFFVTKDVLDYKKGKEILETIKNYEILESEDEFYKILKEKNITFSQEKRYFLFTTKKGKFLKSYYLDSKFKGIKEEYYLSYENNCPLDCIYCYLRDYYEHGAYVFYVNIEDMFKELDEFKGKGEMISAGIVNDSFVFDNITNISSDLIDYFSRREDVLLELRTKTSNIKNLYKKTPNENIVISFTFSPQEVINKYELNTASLDKRIESAKELQEYGYKIGIRIDPIINIENRKEHYNNMIHKIFTSLDSDKIKDIGLGTLRYAKGLKDKVNKEFNTDLFYNELVTGVDGKERYFKPIRLSMYNNIISTIKNYGEFDIYLGMEEEYIWDKVLK